MKYPMHTNSKPATGEEGRRIIAAVNTNIPLPNDAARATIATIIAYSEQNQLRNKNFEEK